MYTVWEEKEKLLADFYETGIFAFGEEGREMTFSWWKIVGSNLFYALSFWAHWRLWVRHVLAFLAAIGGRFVG